MMKLIFMVAHRIAKNLKENFDIDYNTQVNINVKFLINLINKGEMKMLLENLSLEELRELNQKVTAKIAEKEAENKTEFTFSFDYTNDTRKGTPYAAKLVYKDGKVNREFFSLSKEYGKKEVTVSGNYNAKVGEIIEIREGGSWKNDYRYWYLVKENGQLEKVADIDDSKRKALVTKYLRNEIKSSDLLGSWY
ncbi:MAG: hypothetical protein ACFFDH_00665 [Promethearchaeota archaeon]